MSLLPRHPWKIAFLSGAGFGLAASTLAMVAAWDHNPQSEFHEELRIHWEALLYIGASWFVLVGLIAGLVSRVALLIANRHAERESPR